MFSSLFGFAGVLTVAATTVRICGSPVLGSSASLASSLCPLLASYASPPPQPQHRSPTALSLCHVHGSLVRQRPCLCAAPDVAPLLVVSVLANLWFPCLLVMILGYGIAQIRVGAKSPLGLPMLAAVMLASVVPSLAALLWPPFYAPLRVPGEALGPIPRIGWWWRHDVILLLQGAVLLAHGVPGVCFWRCWTSCWFGLPLKAWFFRALCMTSTVLLPCLLAPTRPGPAAHFPVSRHYWWGYVDPIESGAVDAGWTLS